MQKILSYFKKDKTVLFILFCLVIVDRIQLLINFNFKYVGSDDLIFWQSAKDYMTGVFHEPYFYGQNYNFMLESFFAIPFLQIGMPYNIALPVSSCIISMFPFFLFSIVLFKKGYTIESMIFILIPLLLPIEYGILSSVTRGFVSGLFFSGFLIFALVKPFNRSSWIIAAFSISLGYIFNPNSLIVSLPVCSYLLLINYSRISFYFINILVIIPVLLIEFFAKRFYILNPEFNVHGMWPISFSFKKIIENLQHLDKFYGYFTPLLWSAGWFILIGIILIKKDWKKGIGVISGVGFIIVLLGVNKVNDNIDSIFLSSTRMFLGIPLLTGIVFFWSKKIFRLSDKHWKTGLIIIVFSTFFIKSSVYPAVIKYHTLKTNYGPVAIKKVKDLSCECTQIKNIVNTHNIDLIIFVPDWKYNVPYMEFYNYGCPLMESGFPRTLMSIYEKRTWVYLKEKTEIGKNVMIYGAEVNLENTIKNMNCIILSTDPSIIIVNNNSLTTESLLKLLNIDLKRNSY